MVFQRRSSLGGILLAFVLLAILVNTLAVQTDSNDSSSIVPTSGMNATARVNAESEKDKFVSVNFVLEFPRLKIRVCIDAALRSTILSHSMTLHSIPTSRI
jgi:hypothetical protein